MPINTFYYRSIGRVPRVVTCLSKPLQQNLPNIKKYPGEYSIGNLNYNASNGGGRKVPPHEFGHKIICRNSDRTLVGALTTDPKPTFESKLISSTEYMNGKPVLNNAPAGSGQYITRVKKPKIIEESEGSKKPVFQRNTEKQAYADKYESKLKEFYENKISDIEVEIRTDKQDSRFYHENGQRDYENFPK